MRYWLFLFACLFVLPSVYAGSASFVTNQYTQPSFNTYYGGSIGTYWPILDEKEQCLARQDVLMQVAPAGCQPSVVRSDLLAEQNVPVFCQLNALQINPLVTIKELESIRFTGNYPKEVSSVGFHPARAALRTRDQLLGDPLLNNVGYVVIVLKKQPKESELPSSVKLMLSANIKYDAGNARGVGKSEFLLTEQSDEEWTQAQKEGRQGFFNGKYQVRLEDADVRGATVGIYSGVRKLGEAQVEQGKQSSEIFLPGSYCRAGVRAELLGYEIGKERATLRITGTYGTETVDVYQGSSFLQGQCRLTRLVIDNRTGRTGEVEIKCASAKAFKLKLLPNAGVYEVFTLDDGSLITPSQTGEIDFGQRTPAYTSGRFRLSSIGALQHYNQTAQGQGWVNLSLTGSGEQVLWYRALLVGLQEHLKQQKTQNTPTPKVLREKSYASDIEANFSATIASYRAVAQQYPGEKGTDLEGIETYGEQALYRAAQLAGSYGKQSTQATLLQELLTTYPDSVSFIRYQQELTQLSEIDGSESSAVLSLQNVYRTITLTSLIRPAQTASVRLQINNEPVILHVGENWTRDSGFIRLSRLEADRVLLETNCAFNVRRAETSFVQVEERSGRGGVRTVTMGENDDGTICGRGVRIAEIDSEKLARIRLTTSAERTETTTNVSVQIGIEKRAIQLSPAKTAERIGNLNKSIQKWDQLNKNVGKVVTTMKAACFATAGVLTVKNFFAGLSGKGFARKEAMGGANGWTEFCRKQVGAGTDGLRTFDQCYLKYAPDIDADVAKRDAAVKQVNARITAIQKQDGVKTSEGFFGDSVNTDEAAKRYRTELQNTYGDTLKGVSLEHASYTELRELDMNLLLQQQGGGSEQLQKDARVKLEGIQKSAAGQALLAQQLKADAEVAQRGDIRGLVVAPNSQLPRQAAIISQAAVNTTGARYYAGDFKYYTKVIATGSSDAQGNTYGSDTYGLGLAKQSDGTYVVQEVFQSNGTPLPAGERERFITQYNVGSFKDSASSNWEKYKWDKPVIQYYETDPYKGLPALVPVDPDHGWYAATKQTLPAFGGLAGWESSGRVASFYLCNVGENRKPDVFNGYNDDSCTLINLASGQAADKVPGVSETRAQQLVKQAREALEEAARAHKQGAKSLRLQGSQHKTPYAVEKPAVSVPGVQCQDFMSPTECNLLFNVCDPVICPASRCDFGGKYPVQDVIQSGIIGSTLLCMPNFPEVKIPVCLSGIHAGIDAYTKILQAHRDCLQESLTSGRMVGICDQIYSIYSCEFFWRQLSPIANLVVPKLFEQAQGQGARGGGEYLTVQNAWTNTKQSTDYLTTVYGVNAFKAFQARSTEEVGGEVCKGFISGTFPGSFKSLVQPDSPVQFNAFFSTIKYTDATVPATSQYKVFYHIYAGKDQGISYRVFLKNPPATSYYASQPTIQVSSGFIGKGLFKDETKDFTAPEGYQELCVVINGDERCGFKQVSTSFAVNQLRDAVVADELKNTNIASEQACISGTVSAAALLNPNLNQMADEAADPAIYRRGIIRVCSSGNPGQTTDPSRFADVGYCGDMKLRCWLDRQSVQNAITDVNKGVKNETYQWFANQTLANLQKDGKVLGADAGFSELTRLEGVVSGLENYQGQKSRLSADQSTRLGLLFLEFGQTKEALFFNHHRARLGWLVGRAQEVLFKHTFAARADDTRQTGQLDKGILVRENGRVWEIRFDRSQPWESFDSFLSSNDYAQQLSAFQTALVDYLQITDPEEAHITLLGGSGRAQGVTVTSTNETEQAYYYIPFGDSPSSSDVGTNGNPAVAAQDAAGAGSSGTAGVGGAQGVTPVISVSRIICTLATTSELDAPAVHFGFNTVISKWEWSFDKKNWNALTEIYGIHEDTDQSFQLSGNASLVAQALQSTSSFAVGKIDLQKYGATGECLTASTPVVAGTTSPSGIAAGSSLSGELFLHFTSQGVWKVSLRSATGIAYSLDAFNELFLGSAGLSLEYLPLLESLKETTSYLEAQSILRSEWEPRGFTIQERSSDNLFAITYGNAPVVSPTSGVTPSGATPHTPRTSNVAKPLGAFRLDTSLPRMGAEENRISAISSTKKLIDTSFYIVKKGTLFTVKYRATVSGANWFGRDLEVGRAFIGTEGGTGDGGVLEVTLQPVLSRIPSAERTDAVKYARLLHEGIIDGVEIYSQDALPQEQTITGGKTGGKGF